ncbi:MAG: VWA domain-containing protein [Pseudomonadota bacterium]
MPSFAHPLFLLLLPPVLWLAWRWRVGAPVAFSRTPLRLRHPVLATMSLKAQDAQRKPRFWLPWTLALLILAAAQPQTDGGWLPPIAEGRDILLLIDLSPSMSIQDMQLDEKTVPRMQVLQHAAANFIEAREHDRMGLIVFSDHAASIVPLTSDRAVVQAQLARLAPGSTGSATAIGEGLGVAMRSIAANTRNPPLLLLFSDGDNTGGLLRPREALAYAQGLGLHIYSIAVTPDSLPPSAQADGQREPGLDEISQISGGRAYQASDAASLSRILHDINQREAAHAPPPTERAKLDWYPLPLGLALLILALGQWAELRGGGRR